MGEVKMLKSFLEALAELVGPEDELHIADDSHAIAQDCCVDEAW